VTVEELLAEARATLRRLTPEEADGARRAGAVLVDIRSVDQRQRDGAVPGPNVVVVARNVLEWRADPEGEHRDPRIADAGRTVVVLCHEGYQSSLAAATLQRLGLRRATDVVGGFKAWRAAGLPVVRPGAGPS
jgi:rhodanese-related sulfurtransferase